MTYHTIITGISKLESLYFTRFVHARTAAHHTSAPEDLWKHYETKADQPCLLPTGCYVLISGH